MKKTLKIPEQLFRTASVTLTKTAKEGDEEEMCMSISSDEPYKRYDWMADEEYFEVLDHSDGSVDDARLKNGLPILFNHDRNQHLGRATDYINDGKKITVSGIKWASSEFAQEKKKDALSGALPDTSVGYRILDDGICIGEKDGIPIYKFKWALHEASLVTIPADITVGVGRHRAADSPINLIEISVLRKETVDSPEKTDTTRTTPMADPITPPTETKPTVNVVEERQQATRTERERVKRINDYVSALKKPEWKTAASEVAVKAIESGDDFDTFRTNALNSFEGVTQAVQTSEIGMSAKELKNYSLVRAMRQRYLGKPLDGLEKEASDATAKLIGREADGFFIAEDWSNRSLQEIHGISQRTLTSGNFTSAGALIGTDLLAGSLIELLRNKTVMLSSGVTALGGLVGNVAIPRQSGGATAYWLAEGGTVTASDQTFQQLGLTPHRLAAQTAYDKQLLAQSSISVEAMVRNDIALVMAIKKDLASISGTGAGGEPLGIINTAGVGTVTFGAAATWAKVISFETALAVANADQTGMPIWVTTPAVRGAWKVTTKIASSQYSNFLWDVDNTVNGYAAKVTNQVPSDKVLFFVPSEIIDATWAGIDVVVNPYSLDSTGQIRTTVQMFADIAVRHAGAMQVSTDSGAQ
jgi:HK97 family phage major capsid protein